jgi:hypothetical protein
MTSLLLLRILLLHVQEASGNRPALVRCVCGKLVYDHEISQKKASANPQHKRKSAHHAPVVLYPRSENVSCCEGQSPIVSIKTDRFGVFEINGIRPSAYWLAVPSSGHKANTAIRYEPLKDIRSSASDYIYVLNDAGELSLEFNMLID